MYDDFIIKWWRLAFGTYIILEVYRNSYVTPNGILSKRYLLEKGKIKAKIATTGDIDQSNRRKVFNIVDTLPLI